MRKILTFIVIGSVIVLSLTFATYFVLSKFNPDMEIQRMLIAMSRLKTMTESSGFDWKTKQNGLDVHTTLYTNGQMNLEDPSRFEHDTKFHTVVLDAEKSYTNLSGEWKTIGGKTYLTYDPPGPNVRGISFAQSGTWISFERGETTSWGSMILDVVWPVPFSEHQILWSREGLKNVRVLLSRADILHVKFDGVTELVRGKQARLINARFDEEALVSFLLDVLRSRDAEEPSDSDRLLAQEQAHALSDLSVRLWIGVSDHLLYRAEFHGSIKTSDKTVLIPFDARVELSDFNKPFSPDVPNLPLAFGSFLQNLLPAESANVRTAVSQLAPVPTISLDISLSKQSFNPSLDPDHDGLDNTVETFYGTNLNKADTDGDGVNDGAEVRRGRNPRGEGSLFGFGLGR